MSPPLSEKAGLGGVVALSAPLRPRADQLALALGVARLEAQDLPAMADGTLVLALSDSHLALRQLGAAAPGPVYADFVGGAVGHRRQFGGGRGQLIARAVGIKKDRIPSVVDATAGLGRDAFVLASLGCRVRMVEASAVIAALLRDGLARAADDEAVAGIIARLSLHPGDARVVLPQLQQEAAIDVVYLDPMFPQRDKRALVKKEMRLFKALLGESSHHDGELLRQALAVAGKRVVVKRPRKAPALEGPAPDLVFEGKSTRFDVYLRHTNQ